MLAIRITLEISGCPTSLILRYNFLLHLPRRGGREAEGGGLLIQPALFVLTTIRAF